MTYVGRMKRLLPLLAALALPACTQAEESVANRFDRVDAEIRNTAAEITADTENSVRAIESDTQNQIDALDFQANLTVDTNLSVSNSAR